MRKIAMILVFACVAMSQTQAQKYFSKTGEISFFSKTPIENIEAVSHSASTVYDSESGNIQWAVLIKSFEFEKALMQEHFNENYMESSKYPKGKFKGAIANHEGIDLKTDGVYTVDVNGTLEIHGQTQSINTTATFTVEKGQISAASNFKIALADYGIEIPSVVQDNIAKEVEVSIKTKYEILDKS